MKPAAGAVAGVGVEKLWATVKTDESRFVLYRLLDQVLTVCRLQVGAERPRTETTCRQLASRGAARIQEFGSCMLPVSNTPLQ